ncbi:MAG: pro-sigmaK processing inhibitor BofA family protein [Eubacteriaceae bacterium]|nr:pro-sigmaK processing inhibitor BofA family protein [Eubacteriaceae bacterium]
MLKLRISHRPLTVALPVIGIDLASIAAYLAALLVLLFLGLFLFRLFEVPLRILSKLIFNSLIGGIALFLLSFILGFFNINLAVNVFNAIFVGLLGIPGLITIIILNFIL